jgi:hypothetical protein
MVITGVFKDKGSPDKFVRGFPIEHLDAMYRFTRLKE